MYIAWRWDIYLCGIKWYCILHYLLLLFLHYAWDHYISLRLYKTKSVIWIVTSRDHHIVSNLQHLDWVFRPATKKSSKLGPYTGDRWYPHTKGRWYGTRKSRDYVYGIWQSTSYEKNYFRVKSNKGTVSMSWRHHELPLLHQHNLTR